MILSDFGFVDQILDGILGIRLDDIAVHRDRVAFGNQAVDGVFEGAVDVDAADEDVVVSGRQQEGELVGTEHVLLLVVVRRPHHHDVFLGDGRLVELADVDNPRWLDLLERVNPVVRIIVFQHVDEAEVAFLVFQD